MQLNCSFCMVPILYVKKTCQSSLLLNKKMLKTTLILFKSSPCQRNLEQLRKVKSSTRRLTHRETIACLAKLNTGSSAMLYLMIKTLSPELRGTAFVTFHWPYNKNNCRNTHKPFFSFSTSNLNQELLLTFPNVMNFYGHTRLFAMYYQ